MERWSNGWREIIMPDLNEEEVSMPLFPSVGGEFNPAIVFQSAIGKKDFHLSTSLMESFGQNNI